MQSKIFEIIIIFGFFPIYPPLGKGPVGGRGLRRTAFAVSDPGRSFNGGESKGPVFPEQALDFVLSADPVSFSVVCLRLSLDRLFRIRRSVAVD